MTEYLDPTDSVAVPRKTARNENPNLEITRKDGSHPPISDGAGVADAPAPQSPPAIGFPD